MNRTFKFETLGEYATHEPLKTDWVAPGGAYRIDWTKGYRLEVLALGRRNIFPRLEHALSTDRVLLGKPVMVVGEEGAGLTSFFAFHDKRLEFRSHDFTTNSSSSLTDLLRGSGDVGIDSSPPEGRPRDELCPVLFAHLERLSASGEIVAQIRSLSEGFSDQTPLDRGLYFTGRDERVFDSGVYSEFSNISSVTRLPRLNHEEITKLLARHLGGPEALPEPYRAGAMTVLRWTGGQPLLIQSLLSAIETIEDLHQPKLMRRLRDNPPPVVLNWQRRLAQMLEDSSGKPYATELSNAVRDLLKGQSYPIDVEESDLWAPMCLRPLCLAGWLSPGLSEDGNSRIWRLSDLHQFWAQPVVRHPKAFLIRSSSQ
ncbi:hypothetical protein C7S18_08275 [Ahniella affigens]|uniref:Uncharacterized protein n=1 Tax=Ahniella affigens TaxID=2021234 RepID=A0A2P1PQR7_9GAMM|nr:hypothetical protein [Ahniella affigens]AVP97190.1 hypothetical protein C7S18_08275 [Ahniella affigens]